MSVGCWTLGGLLTSSPSQKKLEILVILPNTAAARVAEERLRGMFPKATFGVAPYNRGDMVGASSNAPATLP